MHRRLWPQYILFDYAECKNAEMSIWQPQQQVLLPTYTCIYILKCNVKRTKYGYSNDATYVGENWYDNVSIFSEKILSNCTVSLTPLCCLAFSSWPRTDKNGAWHFGGCEPSIHCTTQLWFVICILVEYLLQFHYSQIHHLYVWHCYNQNCCYAIYNNVFHLR